MFDQNYKFVYIVTRGKKVFPFFVIDYEFSIIDHHNNLIIDQSLALADYRPISSIKHVQFHTMSDELML